MDVDRKTVDWLARHDVMLRVQDALSEVSMVKLMMRSGAGFNYAMMARDRTSRETDRIKMAIRRCFPQSPH